MRPSERQPRAAAVRNSSFAGVILAKAAFFEIDKEKNDVDSRNIDRQFFYAQAQTLRKLARILL
ncbi:hypothetical protein RFN28_13020 [Mesorhizobium sp. VK24D]|uniref:Uncharacterized protein n=1 Tax=Mesorhizobium album TaxID=3072314 RepID=A0ABU4Y0G9_9HYPH|nr:hypothetical protein [Mesorhizobium sp. VK24D]MDX8479394.1 hypothetical protein [Mesorhizobium sp. VK24D]